MSLVLFLRESCVVICVRPSVPPSLPPSLPPPAHRVSRREAAPHVMDVLKEIPHLLDYPREFAIAFALSCDCHVTCMCVYIGCGLIFAVLAVLVAILVGVVLVLY